MSRKTETAGLSQRGRRRALQLWAYYLLSLTAWVTVVFALTILGYWICESLFWYDGSPTYYFLRWVRDNIMLVCCLVILLGWIMISYFFIARPVQQMEAMIQAAGQLAKPEEDPIRLPDSLSDVEAQLNTIRERALRDAQAVQEAEQRKNDLVVYLAHDLKTPLTSVIGYLTLLRDEPQLSREMQERYTQIALGKAERLEDLINEFFEITRFNLTHLELEKQPIDLTRMLEQVVSEFQPILTEANLTCQLEMPKKLLCPCDPEKLSRVFDNLLRNASYYSFPGTQVRIAGGLVDGIITLTMTNVGKTIPQEKLDRIFEQFYRLDSSRATRTGGAGLGLAIAKEIVELHGGTIRAESMDDTVTFTVCLPAA